MKDLKSALAKRVAKTVMKKCGKPSLTRKNLSKLGRETLEEKVQRIADDCEDEEEAATRLKKDLTKVEHSRVWNKHDKHLKANPAAAAEQKDLNKKEKGLAAALWFVKQCRPKFLNLQMSLDATDRVSKVHEWMSEKQANDKFGDEELQRHINSGRVLWREDPWTKGVYQYKDQGDVKRTQNFTRGRHLSQNQESEATEDQEAFFAELFDQDSLLCVIVAKVFGLMFIKY